ncbi:2-amino-4-hydroxy-6-hydroxymethyldihydropteridine diphosphokinase [Alteromonas oceanisediminis]|uniref:2-amino-4-hydroxy-6- hydroxymethyldihydropteridine diphosphokinase n=1 Tax=Alteromonas oceanisediminis TaxID=2836180 RepID=UPI001BD9A6CE|nr:2-amino-4-hydroxy-6-hydroxymethyldihydropteridine diphosphokinase [Alteromonas oceanisediminis]MBT0585301.1 2-amino-4-hydroxy-6-hydroxymethyldihydropteridine diphosphokinase [Alteromonas oceanisediminis]
MLRHHILISVGSNIQRETHTRSGVEALQNLFSDVTLSSVYESEAVGFSGTAFYNLVVSAYTTMAVGDVCRTLKAIERENGRMPSEKKFAPRTLDLDLLTYDSLVTQSPVVLPREEITYNAFVLQPLAEIVPDEVHPVVQKTYATLWAEYDKKQQRLWPIDFSWN